MNDEIAKQTVTAQNDPLSDEALLDLVQQKTFRYFWDFAHSTSGMAFERVFRDYDLGPYDYLVTTGGTGFGIMSILVAIEREFIEYDEGKARINKIVDFLSRPETTKYKGAFPHWMDGRDGSTIPFSDTDNGADLVETAFLMQGLLTARQYFFADSTLTNKIDALWLAVDWDYFRNGSDTLYWHINKDFQLIAPLAITGWNEAMITYILAIASPTHPVDPSLWRKGWSQGSYNNKNQTYEGITLPIGPEMGGGMFFAHYSFQGFNPRGLRDTANDVNYFQQNLAHSEIQHAWCVSNPGGFIGYGDNCWDLTPSNDPDGYRNHAAGQGNDNGTITPSAALSSFPYLPDKSMAALRHFYEELGSKIWTEKCGFVDAFNEGDEWFNDQYLAIDQGPIINMIENYRSGLLWQNFMSCPEIQSALGRIGFQPESLPDNLA